MTRPAPRPVALRLPRLVLLDLDGTLIDTLPDLAHCVDEMLVELGQAPCGPARVGRWVGNGVERLVHRALTGAMDGEAKEVELAPALESFLRCYEDNICTRSRVFSGVHEGLDHLADRGCELACVTNKPYRHTELLLRGLGLRKRFALVLGGDSLAARKPDPLPLRHAMAHFGVSSAETLLVGDSRNDVLAARAAGVPVICMSYGYNHGEDIALAGPDRVLGSLDELEHLLQ